MKTKGTLVNMVREISIRTGINQSEIHTIISCYLSLVREYILRGEDVYLKNIGKFFTEWRRAYRYWNMHEKKHCIKERSIKLKFRASKKIKELIKSGMTENGRTYSTGGKNEESK